MNRSVVIAGSVAQRPFHGGHAWVFLQYLLGFARLGWDVLFLDDLPEGTAVDAEGRPSAQACSFNAAFLDQLMRRFDIPYSLTLSAGQRLGLPVAEVLDRVRRSDLLINVMGFLQDPQILESARRRVFLDIDPGFGQIWRELGLHDAMRGHEQFVTVGLNIGRPGCEVPTCGLEWIPIPPPIVLEHWPFSAALPGSALRLTTVASWRGPFGPVVWNGRPLGLRVHEFRRFAGLPKRANAQFEIALDIDPVEQRDLTLLRDNGWRMVDPRHVADTPWTYRQYVQKSDAELMIAKNLYVQTRGGWFSDRSACYLASGRPVLAQDTGLEGLLPAGEGLLLFSSMDETVAGVQRLVTDYDHHARAARALAEQFFDSDLVLSRLVDRLGI